MTIGIVAGEASGDALAATLIRAVKSRLPEARFVGVAGPRMEAAGCEAWYPLETLSVRGIVEVISRLPQLVMLRRALFRRLVAERVPVFVGVDAPDFNLGLEAKLKRSGARTLHLVSPSVWAWRRERLRTIRRAVHRMLALFPFEPPLYEAAGIPVTFVGHPLASDAAVLSSRREAREQLKLGIAQPVFALLPGSRASELDMHGDLVLRAAEALHAVRPEAQFLVPLATRPTRDRFEAAIYRLGLDKLPLTLLYGHATDALRAADVALVASGTATLEAALARCPHVIFYRLNALTARIVGRRLLLPWVGLPNILAGKFVVPELLQDDATAENLALAAANLYDDTVTRRRLEALFAGFAASLAVDTGALAADAVMAELRAAGVGMLTSSIMELVAGIDEAGRGPLAGPVVAAAVILDPRRRIRGLRDSKLLPERERDRLAAEIRVKAVAWSVGKADVDEIDRINILQATMLAMRRAFEGLSITPGVAWIDGNRCPELGCAMLAIVNGDRDHAVISAASIIAKTTRDAMLVELDDAISGVRLCPQPWLRHARASCGARAPRAVSCASQELRARRPGRLRLLTGRAAARAPFNPADASLRTVSSEGR